MFEEKDGATREAGLTTSESSIAFTSLTCNAAAVLMSRQLRVLCEISLQTFAAFFRSFELQSSGISVFQLDLQLKKLIGVWVAGASKVPCDIVELVPSLEELRCQADAAITCLVTSAGELPHPGAKHIAKAARKNLWA